MKFSAYFRSLAAKFFHRSKTSQDMDAELLSHIQHRADDLERTGMVRAEAERRARIEFGGQERFKEESYEALGGHFIETLLQDLRFSLRVLSKSPGFTIAAVLTLALGIGANAVVFGVLNALILRPLNVPHAQSLWALERGNARAINHSYPDYLDLRDRNRSFEALAAYSLAPVRIIREGRTPNQCPGFSTGWANRDLRRAGHCFDGRSARTGALAAQQFRF